MAEVDFHPEAQAEYQASLQWYLARSRRAATRFEAEVERILGLIVANPELYPPYDDQHRFAVLKRFPFSIIYQIQPNRIWIVAVAHAARTPDYWSRRR